MVLMSRTNTGEWTLQGRLGAVAGSVIDNESNAGCAKNEVPVRCPGIAANKVAEGRVL
jgi:hypothetical protein